MMIDQLKAMIYERDGIPSDQQCVIHAGEQLEDERTLTNYNIFKKTTMCLVLRLRAGMYHETSGRRGFNKLSYPDAMAIKKVLAFQFKDEQQSNHLTAPQLQNSILETQNLLLMLLNEIKDYALPQTVPSLRAILVPITVDSDEDESDSDDSNDQ